MVLEKSMQICIKPVPTQLCRRLTGSSSGDMSKNEKSGCICSQIDQQQYACSCPGNEQCLLLKGPPKIYIEPSLRPYEVEPGGNCHASNDLGVVSRTITIEVTGPGSPPIVTKILSDRTNLKVEWDPPAIISRPVTSYTIYYTDKGKKPLKDWESVVVEEPNHSVVLSGLKPNTKYHLRMRATDSRGQGRIGNSFALNTRKPAQKPQIKIAQGKQIRVKPLQPFALICNVTKSDPIAEVSWQNKGRLVNAKSKSVSSVLNHAGLYEETSFTCVSENEAGVTTAEIAVVLTGSLQPEKIKPVADFNDINLSWKPPLISNGQMRDYEILYTEDDTLPDSEWKSVKVGSPDANVYKLPNLKEKTPYKVKMRGINEKGEGLMSDPIEVVTGLAPRKPEVTLEPSTPIEKKPSNDDLVFECTSVAVPKAQIVWYWGNLPVVDGVDGFRVYDITPLDAQDRTKSQLVSEQTTRSGNISCKSVNEQGEDSKQNTVKILGPGSPPHGIITTPNENGFSASWVPPNIPNGNIKNYVLYYTKDPDAEMSDWKTVVVEGDKLGTTILDQDEDTNYYIKVQAGNEENLGIISEAIEVKTGQKHIPLAVSLQIVDPMSVEHEDVAITIAPNKVIRFFCLASGRPTPDVTFSWLSTNNETDSGSQPEPVRIEETEAGSHMYKSVELSTSTPTRRVLICQARNRDGSQVSKTVFEVNYPGSPPQNIQSDVGTDNSVSLTWNQPKFPNGAITGYKIYLTPDPSLPLDKWIPYETLNPDERKIDFSRGELEPDTTYFAKISAVNGNGEGILSDVEDFQTGTGAPIDSPSDVLPTVHENNNVDVTFFGPKLPNGVIEGYNVYFIPENDPRASGDYKYWDKINIPSSENFINVSIPKSQYNIKPNTTYHVKVAGVNDMNEGPASDTVHFETGTGETAPVITLNPPNNRIEVKPGGQIIVECTATGIYTPSVKWIDSDGNEILSSVLDVKDVRKDTTYICKAANNIKEVQEILEVVVNGPGTPPNELVALPISSGKKDKSGNIEWTSPDIPNGNIVGYVVEYAEVDPERKKPLEWKEIKVDGPVEKVQLDGLKPKTDYLVRVSAVSDRGQGVTTESVNLRTLPTAPEKVETPEIQVFGNNSIEIQFPAVTDPEDPTKKVDKYVVIYSDEDTPTDDSQWKEMTYIAPDNTLETITIPIDGNAFKPDTKYTLKVVPRGEVDGFPSDAETFETTDGIVAPSIPELDVIPEANDTIKIPPGTDYAVTCKSDGSPKPKIVWLDQHGAVASSGPVYHGEDIKASLQLKCVAENIGGKTEKKLNFHVLGPGTHPENVKLSSTRPRTIDITFYPPAITNGNISRYVVYYTKLENQDPSKEFGQVPEKPVREWMTYHVTGDNLNDGEQKAALTGVEPDTSYAVIVQSANDDGPGPYSSTQTIRTISKAREAAPEDLKVTSYSPYGVDIVWGNPPSLQEMPIGYELFYVPANRKVESEDDKKLDDWDKIDINEVRNTIKMEDLPESDEDLKNGVYRGKLAPDSEYVFKIRAIYPGGPGVFSKACISRTLPLGKAPYITTSNGGAGVTGRTVIDLLPGSSFRLWCNSSGDPFPSIRWVRVGDHPIDPSTVKVDEGHAEWSLKVNNITEDATFMCIAENSLGIAKHTIVLSIQEQPENWQEDFVKPKIENGKVMLEFTDDLPDYLKNSTDWTILYTADKNLPVEQWDNINGQGPLDSIEIPDMDKGTFYFVIVDNPKRGIQTPRFSILTPKSPTDLRVGTNMNGETVVSFKPAVTSEKVENYEIEIKNKDSPEDVIIQKVENIDKPNVVIDDIQPGTNYIFTVKATLDNGEVLSSDPVEAQTNPEGIECSCTQGCGITKDENNNDVPTCYCFEGYQLGEDGVTCESVEKIEQLQQNIDVTQEPPTTENPINVQNIAAGETTMDPRFIAVEVTDIDKGVGEGKESIDTVYNKNGGPKLIEPTSEIKTLPVIPGLEIVEYDDDVNPTDIYGKEVFPVVNQFNQPLQKNADGRYIDNMGNLIEVDNDNKPLHPETGLQLPQNEKDQFIYPIMGKNNEVLPTSSSQLPVYPIVDAQGNLFPTHPSTKANIDHSGKPIPTNQYGEPRSEEGLSLPTSEAQTYVFDDSAPEIVTPTDPYGRPIYQIKTDSGELLPTDPYTLRPVDQQGNIIETDNEGRPLGPDGTTVLKKDADGNYIYPVIKVDETPTSVTTPLTEKDRGAESSEVTPKLDIVQEKPDKSSETTEESSVDSTIKPTAIVIEGVNLEEYKKDPSGRYINEEGDVIVDGNGFPVDKNSNIWPKDQDNKYQKPEETASGDVIYPVLDKDGHLLEVDDDGHAIQDGERLKTDSRKRPLDTLGNVLPRDKFGNFRQPAVDENNKVVYPVVDPEGNLVNEPIPTNDKGLPIDKLNNTLMIDDNGFYKLPRLDSKQNPIYPIVNKKNEPLKSEDDQFLDDDQMPFLKDSKGRPIDSNRQNLPQNDQGYYIAPEKIDGKIIYPVKDSKNVVLGSDSTSHIVDPEGNLIETNEDSLPIISGEILPKDDKGFFVLPDKDEDGKLIFPVKDATGSILPTESSSKRPFYPDSNAVIATDEVGRPLDIDGNVLNKDASGNYILPETILSTKKPTDDSETLPTDVSQLEKLTTILPVINPEDIEEVEVKTTDAYGKEIFPIVDIFGVPLLRKDDKYVDNNGNEVELNSDNIPLHPETGLELPKKENGEFVYPFILPDGKIAPMSTSNKPVYEIVDSQNNLYPTHETSKARVDNENNPIPTSVFGLPLSKDLLPLPTNEAKQFVYDSTIPDEELFALPTDEYGKVIHHPIKDSEGALLSTEATSGKYLDKDNNAIDVNERNEPIDASTGDVLQKDASGTYIYPDIVTQISSTDSSGDIIHVTGEDRKLDAHATEIYPETTDKSDKPTIIITDSEGQLLSTDSTGDYIDKEGNRIKLNENNEPVTDDNIVLEKDSHGNYVIKSEDVLTEVTKPTIGDVSEETIAETLPTENIKATIDTGSEEVDSMTTPQYSQPLYPIVDVFGAFIYPEEDLQIFSTDSSGDIIEVTVEDKKLDIIKETTPKPTIIITDSEGQLLSTDSTGDYIDKEGNRIKLNENNEPVTDDNIVLEKDSHGNYVIKSEDVLTEVTKPTIGDVSEETIAETLPTENIKATIDTGSEEVDSMTTPKYSQPLYPIVDVFGEPLLKNEDGNYVDNLGNVVKINSDNIPIDPSGNLLLHNEDGDYVYPLVNEKNEIIPTSPTSKKPIYPIHDVDGSLYPTDSVTKEHVDHDENIIKTDKFGVPVTKEGLPLSTDASKAYIYESSPETILAEENKMEPTKLPTDSEEEHEVLPTTKAGTKVYITDSQGQLLNINSDGQYVDEDKNLIQVNDDGEPIDSHSQVLPKNAQGQYIYDSRSDGILPEVTKETEAETLSTDQTIIEKVASTHVPIVIQPGDELEEEVKSTDVYGKEIYPVVNQFNQPLQKNSDGKYIDNLGNEIELNNDNVPLHPQSGLELQKNDKSEYVYPIILPDGKIAPMSTSNKPVYEIVDSQNNLYPTHETSKARVDNENNLIPTSMFGLPLSKDLLPLPTNEAKQFVYDLTIPDEELFALPTDQYGKVIHHPIKDSEGVLLSTEATSGKYLDKDNNVIDVNERNEPVIGTTVLEKDSTGHYIYPSDLLPTPSIFAPTIETITKDTELIKQKQLDRCPEALREASLMFIFETSKDSQIIFERFRAILLEFFTKKLDIKREKVGLAHYGNSVEVLFDISNYDELEEIRDSLMELHFTGGKADPLLALRSIIQLVHESNELNEKVMILFTMTQITGQVKETFDKLAKEEEIKVIIVEMSSFIEKGEPTLVLYENICAQLDSEFSTVKHVTSSYEDSQTTQEPKTSEGSYHTDSTRNVVHPIVDSRGYLLPKNKEGKYLDNLDNEIKYDRFDRPLGHDGNVLPQDNLENYVFVDEAISPSIIPTDDDEKCSIKSTNIDLVFGIADNSFSVSDFRSVVDSISEFINKKVNMAPDVTRISIINYGKNVNIPVALGGYQEKREIVLKLRDIAQNSNLERPEFSVLLNAANQQFETFGRKNSEKIVLVVSNGEDVQGYTEEIKDNKFKLIVVALDEFSDEVNDKNVNSLFVDDWSNFNANKIIEAIEDACKVGYIDLPKSSDTFYTTTVAPIQKAIEVIGPDNELDVVTQKPTAEEKINSLTGDDTTSKSTEKTTQEEEIKALPTEDDIEVFPTTKAGTKVYITNSQGQLLNLDSDGHYVDENENLIQLNEDGEPIDSENQVLPKDSEGKYVYSSIKSDDVLTQASKEDIDKITPKTMIHTTQETDAETLSTDQTIIEKVASTHVPIVIQPGDELEEEVKSTDVYGKEIYPVVNQFNQPLQKNSDGKYIDNLGNEIELNNDNVPLNPQSGLELQKNDKSEYVYPIILPDGKIAPMSTSNKPVYEIVDSQNNLYPTHETSKARVDNENNLIPTSMFGLPLSKDLLPLPTNEAKQFVYDLTIPDEELFALPTDEYGKVIHHPIKDSEGVLLSTESSSGQYLDKNNNLIDVNERNEPVIGTTVLEKDASGAFIYPEEDLQIFSTDSSGDIIEVTVEDKKLDIIKETTPKPTIIITDSEGQLLSTDSTGDYIDKEGNRIKLNENNEPVTDDNIVLEKDSHGNYVIKSEDVLTEVTKPTIGDVSEETIAETLPTENIKATIDTGSEEVDSMTTPKYSQPLYPIVDVFGEPLLKNEDGNYVDNLGNVVKINSDNIPIDPSGNLLLHNEDGDYVYPLVNEKNEIIPTSPTSKKPIYPIHDVDGSLYPTDSVTKEHVDHDENIIKTDKFGVPHTLSTDQTIIEKVASTHVPIVIQPGDELEEEVKSTDVYGKEIYPVVNQFNQPLQKNSDGKYIDNLGNEIELNNDNVPLHPQSGLELQKNDKSEYVYPIILPDGKIAPMSTSNKPVYEIVDSQNNLYPTHETSKARVDNENNLIPTSMFGLPLSKDLLPLPTNEAKQFVYDLTIPDEELFALPTDEYGKVIHHPIKDSEGVLLSTESTSGKYLDKDNNVIDVNERNEPVVGTTVLEKDATGVYIYPEEIKPTVPSQKHKDIIIIGPDNTPIKQGSDGKFRDSEGKEVEIHLNSEDKPLDQFNQVLPTSNSGDYVFTTEDQSLTGFSTTSPSQKHKDITIIGPDNTPIKQGSDGKFRDLQGNEIRYNSEGKPLDQFNEILPTTDSGYYTLNEEGFTLPTDEPYSPTHKDIIIIGPDNTPLQKDDEGKYHDSLGNEIHFNSENKPLDKYHNVLNRNKDGNYVLPITYQTLTSETNLEILSTTKKPKLAIYNIVDPVTGPLSKDSSGRFLDKANVLIEVDSEGKPLAPDNSILKIDPESGNYIYPASDAFGNILPTSSSGNPIYNIVDPLGNLLKTNSDGLFVGKNNELINTDHLGRPLGVDGEVLNTDSQGNFIYHATDKDGNLLPVSDGLPIYPIVDFNNVLLKKDPSTGKFVDKKNQLIKIDEIGRPLHPITGAILPMDEISENFVYPATDSKNNILPTSESGIPIYNIVDENSQPLPTRSDGVFLDYSMTPIPTNSAGIPVAYNQSPLPKDESGDNYVFHRTSSSSEEAIYPTNQYGQILFPIIRPDKQYLKTNSEGRYLDENNDEIGINDQGIPVNKNHEILEQKEGKYVYPYYDSRNNIIPSDASGLPLYPIHYYDGTPLKTTDDGRYLDPNDKLIKLDQTTNIPLGPDNKQLKKDEQTDEYIYPAVDAQGSLIQLSPQGLPILVVVDTNQQPLRKNSEGLYLNEVNEPIPTSESGIPLGKDLQPLPQDAYNNYYYDPEAQLLPSTKQDIGEEKSVVDPSHIQILGPDFKLIKPNSDGVYLNQNGDIIEINDDREPLSPDGSVLHKNSENQYLYPALDIETLQPLPTDEDSKLPIYPILSHDGVTLLPTDSTTGRHIDLSSRVIPTNKIGLPLDSEQQVLQKTSQGHYIYPETNNLGELIPTSSDGLKIYNIVGPDMQLLNKNEAGRFVDVNGDEIRLREDSQPIGPDGEVLKINPSNGYYIYPAVGVDGFPLPTDMDSKSPIYPVIQAGSGSPLPTSSTGRHITFGGDLIATERTSFKPLGPDNKVLATDSLQNFIFPVLGLDGLPLPTSSNTGKPLYKIVDIDQNLLPTAQTGEYLGENNMPILTDISGIPIRPNQKPYPMDRLGNYVYDPSLDAITLPTDAPIEVVDHEGKFLQKDETESAFIGPNNEIISIDMEGRPLLDGKILPINSKNQYYLPKAVSLVETTTMMPLVEEIKIMKDYVIIGPNNEPLRKDNKTNRHYNQIGEIVPVDNNFEPLNPNGDILSKKDDEYRYPAIGPDGKMLPLDERNQKPIYGVTDVSGNLLPTSETGLHTFNGQTIPTDQTGIPLGFDSSPLPIGEKGYHVLAGPVVRTSDHCYVNSYINLLVIYDASEDITVLKYRLMKDLASSFLTDHFNLNINRVRVGLLKYGHTVEVPISFGDYNDQGELLRRLSESHRIKGESNLASALKDAHAEFSIEENASIPHVAIIFKNGKSSESVEEGAKLLRDNHNVKIFVVSAGGNQKEDISLVGAGNADRIVSIDDWRHTKSKDIGRIADRICEFAPNVTGNEAIPWPVRKTDYTVQPKAAMSKICEKIDWTADVLFMLDASDNIDESSYVKVKEGIAVLIDESFDLSPDVVRVGVIQYSDRVSVPIALGHYEDKGEILLNLNDSEKMSGIAVTNKAFDAARVQITEHGRTDVSNVIILITSGNNRGNAIAASLELREHHKAQVFVIAIKPDADQVSSLKRLVGKEHAHDRLMIVKDIDEFQGSTLKYIRNSLCGRVTPAFGGQSTSSPSAFKRSTDENHFTDKPILRTTRAIRPTALCKDKIIRPFFFTLVIDVTARSERADFRNAMRSLGSFFINKFEATPMMAVINLVSVDSNVITYKRIGLDLENVYDELDKLVQSTSDYSSPKLGLAIDEATMMSTENAISGATKVMIVVSSDATSGDEVQPSAEYARDDFGHKFISVSIREPSTEILKKISGDSPTRVIHLSEWNDIEELFSSWVSYAICEAIEEKEVTRKPHKMEELLPEVHEQTASHIELTPITPNSLSVSWICCTNNKQNYIVKYTPDVSIPMENWVTKNATCRDGFGMKINDLPSDFDYFVCVFTTAEAKNIALKYSTKHCNKLHLDKNSVVPKDFDVADEKESGSRCRCRCDEKGKALITSSCSQTTTKQILRPLSTLPPALASDDCPCTIKSQRGLCPRGYYFNKGKCYDINECSEGNGGCNANAYCVNTPGEYFCACPHGMMRDPSDNKKCIMVSQSFDKITELLAQYLHANVKSADLSKIKVGEVLPNVPIQYKAVIESEDRQKKITFEWSQMPSIIKRALKWLI
uniref:Titin n=1 Tax=Rhabditophanes sp. KR3021 TaxID=114890 RepID=A0AC35TXB2_9BILA